MCDSLGYFGFAHKSSYRWWAIDIQPFYYLVLFSATSNSSFAVVSLAQLIETGH